MSELALTVLPNQNTILHYINENFEDLTKFIDIINEVPVAKLGKKAPKKTGAEYDIEINDIQFLPNLEGKTPLHISIEKNNTRFTDLVVETLAVTNFDHHGRFIID